MAWRNLKFLVTLGGMVLGFGGCRRCGLCARCAYVYGARGGFGAAAPLPSTHKSTRPHPPGARRQRSGVLYSDGGSSALMPHLRLGGSIWQATRKATHPTHKATRPDALHTRRNYSCHARPHSCHARPRTFEARGWLLGGFPPSRPRTSPRTPTLPRGGSRPNARG